MTRYLDKIIKNGDERCFQGSGDVDVSGLLFFGSGCDGSCTITRDTTIEARTYEFTTLNICPDVKLSFCGRGIPNIKATECINNQGTIDLRSINCIYSCQVNFAFIGCVCNIPHRSGWSNLSGTNGGSFNCKGGGGGCCGGKKGGSYGNYGAGSGGCQPEGGAPYGPNGGGGAGCYKYDDWDSYYCSKANGGNANELCGGRGGDGVGDGDSRYYAGGGGGGFGMYGGGDGGNGDNGGGGGSGGNSYYGKGGNGGYGTESWYDWGTAGGDGGCSFYGDGGNGGAGGSSNDTSCAGYGGDGGCSVWGNGGNGGTGGAARDHKGAAGGEGGDSLYGNGGNSGNGGTSTYCPQGGVNPPGDSLGGQYGLVLASKNIYNNCIIGCGGNGGNVGSGCNYGSRRGGAGGHGADIHILYTCLFHCGEICNKAGCGGTGGLPGYDGTQGALCICQIIL